MIDHTQSGEQPHILAQFAGTHGRFLDIGAADGFVFSNTRALWEEGWDGIFVEPSPHAIKSLLERYGVAERAMIVNALVMPNAAMVPDGTRLVKFYVTPDMLSTTEAQHKTVWENAGTKFSPMLMPAISVEWLTRELICAKVSQIEFLNIDTEGTSEAILNDFPLDLFRVQMVCVEHDHNHRRIVAAMAERGFDEVATTGNNLILKRRG